MIVNVVPNASNLSETLSSLNFSSRARNAVLSLGNRDTIKKWRDIVSSLSLSLSLSFFLLFCRHCTSKQVNRIGMTLLTKAGYTNSKNSNIKACF